MAVQAIVVVRKLFLFLLQFFPVFFVRQGLVEVDVGQERHFDKAVLSGLNDGAGFLCQPVPVSAELQGGLDGIDDDAEDVKGAGFLIHTGNDVPGRKRKVCVLQHGIRDRDVFIKILQALPVGLGDAPCGVLVCEQGILALLHFILCDVDEELHDEIAVFHQSVLEAVDLVHVAEIRELVDVVVDPHGGDFLIPGAVHDGDLAVFRNRGPVAPHHRLTEIHVRGRLGIDDTVPARIEVLDQLLDQASLARAGPAFKDNNDREIGLLHRPVQGCQLFLQCFDGIFVLSFGDFPLQIDFFQHNAPSGIQN